MIPIAARPAFVVDTSVALKWFVAQDETEVPKALSLQQSYLAGRCRLRAPELLMIELANALKLGRRFEPAEIIQALNYVEGLDLSLEGLRWATLVKAVELASTYEATVYDSYFLAMAVESGGSLITADEAFLRKIGAHPSVISLRQVHVPE